MILTWGCGIFCSMSQIFHNIQLGLDEDLEEKLAWLMPNFGSYHVLRQSVDARRRHEPHLVYSVEVFAQGEHPPENSFALDRVSYQGPP
ncbi:MAG: hypothetical protein KDD43_13040, partial [Bdellovibrionales bacterium]|nr:hypothetical protein [Bdellovibrionales bacterium]